MGLCLLGALASWEVVSYNVSYGRRSCNHYLANLLAVGFGMLDVCCESLMESMERCSLAKVKLEA